MKLMTTIYAYISERFANTVIFTLLSEHGDILSKFECSYASAKKLATSDISHEKCARLLKEDKVYITWLDRPWQEENFKLAQKYYETSHGDAPFNGRFI